MEQFRQIGEAVGSLNALMVFKNSIFNQRQCCLLADMLNSGYNTIAEEMKQNLRFEEKNTKWKIIENPLRDLLRVFKEGEFYIRQCLEPKDWWAKAIYLYQNADCVEFHIHNLLSCIPVVIEAIEMAGEISGWDQDEIQKRKAVYSLKYQKEWKDPRIFEWKFGKEYLVSRDFTTRLDLVWNEDRWLLLKMIQEKKSSGSFTSKRDKRLADLLLTNLTASETTEGKLLPSSTLVNSKDYQVRRRLGSGSQYKEIQWLGESFALRHFFGDIESLIPDITKELSLSHPNIMHVICGFTDEEKKECFLVMELMNRDLSSYIKEICGARKRIPFSLPVAVDLMLQIARGMEYLHSKTIYHGELNLASILVKARSGNSDGYLHAKVSGFGGLSASITLNQKKTSMNQNVQPPVIWYPPEVLSEQEYFGDGVSLKYTEKCDVYSFGMICFEIVTGKVPFEDAHLQGDKMSRNIRAGERPLFPFHSPKYITNLTKKCWHADPSQRPSFSSICRILRYIKRFLAMNPELSQTDLPMPPVDFVDIETGIAKCFPYMGYSNFLSTSQIPFQMFVYRVTERERTCTTHRDNSESGSEETSAYGDENITVEDPFTSPTERRSLPSPESMIRKLSLSKKSLEVKTGKQPGTPRGRSVRPPPITPRGRSISLRLNSESQLMNMSPRTRRTSGHVSDSELS
ncbi:mitogen-activated protein kinase kinase kinase 7-like [Dorcoceras hygrometricum]|uniref:Mitogen-activated protein kinase kinase kinase 7-like n=1 Tax=Dorcoceras hygrometricum TaxID=472368 RepID=A0A2Z7AR96_9LAMI|nr:mitogen-activated protein kinase kinase kinase 7-like [Dorcoceras hygrometricum]KZV21881.1 mitogen-activated protein kinase kinase kinase 7-like [Dorcoceras hygrometricum]